MRTTVYLFNQSDTFVRCHLTKLSGAIQQYHDKIHKQYLKQCERLAQVMVSKMHCGTISSFMPNHFRDRKRLLITSHASTNTHHNCYTWPITSLTEKKNNFVTVHMCYCQ